MAFSASFVGRLAQQDRDMGVVVARWGPRMATTCLALHRITKQPLEDLEQDLLAATWIHVDSWRTPQVRHEGSIWMVSAETSTGYEVYRWGTGERRTFLRDEVELVKKTSLTSYVYQGILQFASEKCAQHFTQKNGFRPDERTPTVTKRVLDRRNREFVVRDRPNMVARYRERLARPLGEKMAEQGYDELDAAMSVDPTPEEWLVAQQLLDRLKRHLPESAGALLVGVAAGDTPEVVARGLGLGSKAAKALWWQLQGVAEVVLREVA